MIHQLLTGAWEFKKFDTSEWKPAQVPGCVHLDLLANGDIPDPFFRDNENKVQWISACGWIYRRKFNVPAQMLACRRVHLVCDGVDTLATITINGQKVGTTDNMFRTWEFELGDVLFEGENTIEISFPSVLPYLEKKARSRTLASWGMGNKQRGWIRKEQCNFGWDWGPTLITCGIWRTISIVAYATARLREMQVTQDHRQRGQVALCINSQIEHVGKEEIAVSLEVVDPDNRTVARADCPVGKAAAACRLIVKRPRLWWPNGMGAQPLYRVNVVLRDTTGNVLDVMTKCIGLRTLTLERKKDRWGQSFHFAANGVPFFAKGANWIPADPFAPRVTAKDYQRLLTAARDAHMNMLRVWGGGIYEDSLFYDLCDELGLCVWQDFMFACGSYPAFDKAFMKNVEQEAVDNVRRIRHHACLALWCGNNELEQGLVGPKWDEHHMSWADYKKLFDVLLPAVVRQHDPGRAYWPASPHTPVGDRTNHADPRSGDAHLWDVWHGRKPFEWYRTTLHRFCSEFGFQSFPEPATIELYTDPADRNVTTRVMEHHQRSGIGNSVIVHYMLNWFLMPKDFTSLVWLSQVQQGLAMKYAVEHWRRQMPRSMGALYWQINDCWPVASWASIDSFGRWKALHYMAKRFFAPLLVSGVEDPAAGTVAVHVTSDLQKTVRGTVRWSITTADGRLVSTGATPLSIAPRKSALAKILRLAEISRQVPAEGCLVWLELETGGKVVAENLVTFTRPKHLELVDPQLETDVREKTAGTFVVTLNAQRPALWGWLELAGRDARYSDNFINVRPGRAVTIEVTPAQELSAAEFKKHLVARSLYDTYSLEK